MHDISFYMRLGAEPPQATESFFGMSEQTKDNTSTSPIIVIENLGKKFMQGKTEVHALRDINLTIERGEIYGIIGRSGAGKSTLVRCINMLEPPTEGRVLFEGRDVTKLSKSELNIVRRSMGMIFQQFNLLMQRTALDNVTFPLELAGMKRDAAKKRGLEMLELVGLANRANAYPAQLSGGQKQRVAIARALAMDPTVILLDEPTSALDPELVGEVLAVIRDLAQHGMTMVMATHQMDFARALANEILFMQNGVIIEQGTPADLLAEGAATRTKDFFTKLTSELE